MITRRNILMLTGGTAAILAAGGAGFALTRTPTRALKPWEDAGTGATPIIQVLSWAILAPNPHNRQPWLVDLSGPKEAVLFCEADRRLPMTDPYDRQITIGLGCFLELARIAAGAMGYEAAVTPFPEGDDGERLDHRPIAHIRLTPREGQTPLALFRAVATRHTTKAPFDMERAVPQSVLESVIAAARVPGVAVSATQQDQDVTAIRTLLWDAWVREAETPDAHLESVNLMRIGKAEIEANPDGIDLGGPFLEVLNIAGVLTRETMADPTSQAYREGFTMYEPMAKSAMAAIWINTAQNRRADQLAAGAAYVRADLAAHVAGLSIHPMSQCLQEYPEMRPYYDQAHSLLTDRGETVQMLARLGYGPAGGRSPRWSIDARIRSA